MIDNNKQPAGASASVLFVLVVDGGTSEQISRGHGAGIGRPSYLA